MPPKCGARAKRFLPGVINKQLGQYEVHERVSFEEVSWIFSVSCALRIF
jgi:hypothetical protein